MDAIEEILKIDIIAVLFGLFVIFSAILAIAKIIEELSILIGKPVKWIRHRNDDHQLILDTANNLKKLQEKQSVDVEQSIKHDKKIKEDLRNFMSEIRDSITETQKQVTEYSDHRVHDREQSFRIQKELTDSIKIIADGGKKREEQIKAVMAGNRELLGAEIDRRFDKYIGLRGIPSDELDEFVSLHDAYKGCKGNHNRDAKYNYIIENLPVLPVESKLMNN